MPIPSAPPPDRTEPHRAAAGHDYVLLPILFILVPIVLLLLAGAVFGEPAGPSLSSVCRFQAVIKGRPHCPMLPGQMAWPRAASVPAGAVMPGAGMPSYRMVPSGVPVRHVGIACERPVRFQEGAGLAYSSAGPDAPQPAAPPPAPSPAPYAGGRPIFIPSEKPLPLGYRMVAERLVQQLLDAALPVFHPCAPPAHEAGSPKSEAG